MALTHFRLDSHMWLVALLLDSANKGHFQHHMGSADTERNNNAKTTLRTHEYFKDFCFLYLVLTACWLAASLITEAVSKLFSPRANKLSSLVSAKLPVVECPVCTHINTQRKKLSA